MLMVESSGGPKILSRKFVTVESTHDDYTEKTCRLGQSPLATKKNRFPKGSWSVICYVRSEIDCVSASIQKKSQKRSKCLITTCGVGGDGLECLRQKCEHQNVPSRRWLPHAIGISSQQQQQPMNNCTSTGKRSTFSVALFIDVLYRLLK